MTDNNAYSDIGDKVTSFNNDVALDVTEDPKDKSMNDDIEHTGPYAGMPKEVLLKYSRQRGFVWARNILAIAVVLTILTLLSMVIALIAVSPACQEFWQTSPIYQIYPKSFSDSDNSAYGDINGIRNKLSYLGDELGVDTIWLNPIYKSPQVDNGYDVEDYRAIDKIYGSMEDMEDFITDLHNRGMKLVMDFVPNHTSDKHYWFLASSNKSHEMHEKYKDYYVWVDSIDGTSTGIPNNWQSVFSDVENSAWEWNNAREQFYYHAFFKEQPDLNLRNEEVLQELLDVLRFWMEKGVDGFRCDALAFMLESKSLRDNPLVDDTLKLSYANTYHDYTENQNGIHDIVVTWRALLNDFSTEPGIYRFMETEVYNPDIDVIMRYYGTKHVKEADFPMNFQLIDNGNDTEAWKGSSIEATVLHWMTNMPQGKWPNWVSITEVDYDIDKLYASDSQMWAAAHQCASKDPQLGNHDNSRLVTRLNQDRARSASFLTLTLSGTPGIYYGEEIGMTDTFIDPLLPENFRDPYRTPMQWNAEENAGFCANCTPWLPVNKNYESVNVEMEQQNPQSILSMYQSLLSLRSEITFLRGWLCMVNSTDKSVVYVREMSGIESYLVAINFNDASDTIDLSTYADSLPQSGEEVARSDMENLGSVDLSSFLLPGNSGVAIRYNPQKFFNARADMADRCFNPRKVCVNVLGLLEVC